jgi:hypothetical protein
MSQPGSGHELAGTGASQLGSLDVPWVERGMLVEVSSDVEEKCSFCGGPASGSGEANLIVHSKDGSASVCGRCIESHAELLRQTNDRVRRRYGESS